MNSEQLFTSALGLSVPWQFKKWGVYLPWIAGTRYIFH
jgi:hypothetical protein